MGNQDGNSPMDLECIDQISLFEKENSSLTKKNLSEAPLIQYAIQNNCQGPAWTRLDQLHKYKLCHHCTKRKWQHSKLPVCLKCQPQLKRVSCRHCAEEFLQHRILLKAEHYFSRIICVSCARNVSEFGLPKTCKLCGRWAVFGQCSHCHRCSESLNRYGTPETCFKCGNNAAFRREPEKMAKVDGLLLCFQCTVKFKKEKYTQKKISVNIASKSIREVPISDTNKSSTTIAALHHELQKQQKNIEKYHNKVTVLQQQLKKKDIEILTYAQKMEQQHFSLRREAEENHRKATREEVRVNQLLNEMAEIDRVRDEEMTKLIEGNQEEREKLIDVIETLKTDYENVGKELAKEKLLGQELVDVVKEKEKEFKKYKCTTEQRVEKVCHKLITVVKKQQERIQEKTQELLNIRHYVTQLERLKEQNFHYENELLGLVDVQTPLPLNHILEEFQQVEDLLQFPIRNLFSSINKTNENAITQDCHMNSGLPYYQQELCNDDKQENIRHALSDKLESYNILQPPLKFIWGMNEESKNNNSDIELRIKQGTHMVNAQM